LSTLGVESISGVAQANDVGTESSTSTSMPAKDDGLNQLIDETWSSLGSNHSEYENSGSISDDNYQITEQQAQKIGAVVAEHAVVTHEGEDTTVTIMDSALDGAYDSVINGKPFYEDRAKSGKTKIVWYGKAKNGNFNLYLSAKMLNKLKSGSITTGVGVIMAALALPLGPIGGVAWFTVKAVLKKVIGAAINSNVSHFKAGRIFKVKGWKYKGWSYQK